MSATLDVAAWAESIKLTTRNWLYGPVRSYAVAAAAPSVTKAAVREYLEKMKMAGSEAKTTKPALRTYKPRSPGVRHLKRPVNDHLWTGRPWMPLTLPKKGHGKGGRNMFGRITVRHRGGGAKRRIRTVDFYRWDGGPRVVERIEYDPNRSAHLALIAQPESTKKSYIIAADGMQAGDIIHSYRSGIPRPLLDSMGGVIDPGILASKTCFRGNCLPLYLIPVGTFIYNIGARPRGPALFCRSAGTYAVILSKGDEKQDGTKVMTEGTVAVQLQSGEVRNLNKDACATIGVVSNPQHHHRQLGKAGRSRWLNIRPTVRGVAMNRVDHPHGGGRGKSKSNQHPQSPWGTLAKGGYRTRRQASRFTAVSRPRGAAKKARLLGKNISKKDKPKKKK